MTGTAHSHHNDAAKQSALYAAMLHFRSSDVWPPALVLIHKIWISLYCVLDNRLTLRGKHNSLFQIEYGKKLEALCMSALYWKWGDTNVTMKIVYCLINSFFNAIPGWLLFFQLQFLSICRLRSAWPPSTHRSPSGTRASQSTTWRWQQTVAWVV